MWIAAVVSGGLVAVVWAGVDLAGDIPAVRPFSSSPLFRSVVLIALLALCRDRFPHCWKASDGPMVTPAATLR
jgi:hypothetical protein